MGDPLANLKPFPKGKSGNPAGRPRIPPEIRELARERSAEALEVHVRIMRNRKAAPSARAASASAILDRAWGKPAQSIEQTNIVGGRPEGVPDEAVIARIHQIAQELGGAGPGAGDAVLVALLEQITGEPADMLMRANGSNGARHTAYEGASWKVSERNGPDDE